MMCVMMIILACQSGYLLSCVIAVQVGTHGTWCTRRCKDVLPASIGAWPKQRHVPWEPTSMWAVNPWRKCE